MIIKELGLVDYEEARRIQKDTGPDALIVTEHHPVFTIGRTGSRDNLLVDEEILEKNGIKFIEIDRGGDITFHGPGQIVLYPIMDLKKRDSDLHKYIRDLEEVMVQFLKAYGIKGERVAGASGAWTTGKKIGFVGIGVSKWISFHGISININTDLNYFSMIRSCGIKGVEITTLSRVLKKTIDIDEAKEELIDSFCNVFGVLDAKKEIPAVA